MMKWAVRALRAVRDAFLEMLFPPGAMCVCCEDQRGLGNDVFCEYCAALYEPLYDSEMLNKPSGLERMYSACRYKSPASDVVKAFKFLRNRYAGDFMAEEMVRAAQNLGVPSPDAIVAVPLHKKRLRERGFNQSERLAEALAGELSAPVLPLLRRIKNTEKQSTLSDAERAGNIQNAFRAPRSCAGMRILLVDDVYTTGATANACASELKRAGAKNVELFVYADASKKKPTSVGMDRIDQGLQNEEGFE